MKKLNLLIVLIILSSISCIKPKIGRENALEVFGFGEISYNANIVTIDVIINNFGSNLQEILSKTKNTSEMLNHIIFELNIEENNINKSKIESKRNYNKENDFIGYSSDQNISIIIENMDIFEIFLEKIIIYEDIYVENIFYSCSNELDYEIKAEKIALDHAEKQAQEISLSMGINLGKIKNITINTYDNEPPKNRYYTYNSYDQKYFKKIIKIINVSYEIR